MPHILGFPPIYGAHARTLILGSMPGRESLRQQRYYAHPRNAFWPIMSELLGLEAMDYTQRVEKIRHQGFAVWDVLKTCLRGDSLDSSIEESSIVANDFNTFYRNQAEIIRVFFNGAKAEAIYRKHILPDLASAHAGISLQRLPSTSPAHAAMSFDQKLAAWRVIVQ